MRYWELTEQARELRSRANNLMDAHNFAPTPSNYLLWFSYELGEDMELKAALDAALADGRAGDAHLAQELHSKFFSGSANAEIDATSLRVQEELRRLSSVLEQTGQGSAAYGRTLGRAAEQLARTDVPPHLKSLIDSVAVATLQMSERNKALEAQVEASAGEIETLRSNMEVVKRENLVDALTGLANRRSFDQSIAAQIQQADETNAPLSLLMCDIDHFKKFNDTWGHATGDQVLRLVANCLSTNVKGGDLAARYGGEELAVVLPNTKLTNAVIVADQIRRSVESRKIVKKSTGQSLGTITLSIGAAQHTIGETTAELIERADACLYAAKRSGRNRVSSAVESSVGVSAR